MMQQQWRLTLVLLATCLMAVSSVAQSMESNEPTPAPLRCAEPGPWRVAMDGQNIYWTDFRAGKVLKAPLSGKEATVLASEQAGPCGITVRGGMVYWTNNTAGTVMAVPIEGGPVTTVASGQDRPGAIGVTDDAVYCAIGVNKTAKFKAKQGRPASSITAFQDVHPSGPTVHCDSCPDYCTRTICDTKSCHTETYICGWHACNCRG